jgi:hypothetical protein
MDELQPLICSRHLSSKDYVSLLDETETDSVSTGNLALVIKASVWRDSVMLRRPTFPKRKIEMER